MAQKHQSSGGSHGKVRIRFMDIEMDGSNETILEGIREIATAMQARTIVRQVQPGPVAPKILANANGASASGHPVVGEPEQAGEEWDDSDGAAASEQQPEAATPSKPRSARTAPKAPPLNEGLQVLTGTMPLSEFCTGLNINKDSPISDKVIVIATWLKEHRAHQEMDASDLFTCCKHMDWSPPTDVTSPMRNLKRDNKLSSKEKGKFELTTLGDKHFRDLKR